MSKLKEPVPIASTSLTKDSLAPKRMIEPLPNCFSIDETANSRALIFSLFTLNILAANIDEGRWVPKNREVLSKLIDENKNKGNYVIFDWDYTSIYQDTQENLFRYQIDKLKFTEISSNKSCIMLRKRIK